jgi:hypothetical protein
LLGALAKKGLVNRGDGQRFMVNARAARNDA